MHAKWKKLTHDQRVIFFNEHTLHCLETFEPDKVELYEVELSFLTGTRLVRAELEPQTVALGGSDPIKIQTAARSYFLYSPNVTHGIKKLIPLSNDRASVDIARSVLETRINESNVVDYVKFFGLIVEGEEGPFVFVSEEKDIPWSENVNDNDRQRLIGALSARTPFNDASGEFDIEVHSERKFGIGSIFRLVIPAIYAGIPFACEMTVTPDGHIRMDEDHAIKFEGIAPAQPKRHYYVVNPTDALRKYMKSKALQSTAWVFVFLLAMAAMFVTSIFAIAGTVAGLADTFLSPWFQGFGSWLNALLSNQAWLRDIFLLGAAVSVCLQIIILAAASWAEYVASHRPGFFETTLDAAKTQVRIKHDTVAKRVRWISGQLIFGLLYQLVLWGLVLYLVPFRFGDTVVVATDQVIYLRDHIGFAFFEALDWFSRGDTPSMIENSFENWFNLPSGTSTLGTTLKWTAAILIPLSLTATATRLWRWTKPEPE